MFFDNGISAWRVILQSCLLLFAAGLATFLTKLYRIRHKFQSMQREGLVSLWGHTDQISEFASLFAH